MGSYAAPADPFSIPIFDCVDLIGINAAPKGRILFTLGSDGVLSPFPVPRVRILLPTLIVPSALAQVTTFMACQVVQRMSGSNSLIH